MSSGSAGSAFVEKAQGTHRTGPDVTQVPSRHPSGLARPSGRRRQARREATGDSRSMVWMTLSTLFPPSSS